MKDLDRVVSLSQICFSWNEKQPATLEFDALDIYRGEHVFIKGPSGSGKSTLLGLFTGIISPQSGTVQILNQQLNQLSQSGRDRFRADHIGYIFQQFNLLPYLSVIENVTLPCSFSKLRRQKVSGELSDNAIHLLERLRLDEALLNKPVIELSIGQQQRVAAARALIGQPELIIADEPTSALDYENRTAFIELLMEEAEKAGSTLIFVSHDPTLEAMFDRNIRLEELNQKAMNHRAEATLCRQ